VALPLWLCEACQPEFLEFFSRNSVRWKYGPNYTLTNGVGKQGKTGRPHASKRLQPAFPEKFQKFGCTLPDLRVSDSPQDAIDRQRIDVEDRFHCLLHLQEKPQTSYGFGGGFTFTCLSPLSICRICRKPVARVNARQIKWYTASLYQLG
jgi:hypothetical protein